MAKEQKTREELLELLDKAIAKHRLGSIPNGQWKIIIV